MRWLGCVVEVRCAEPAALDLLRSNFGPLVGTEGPPALRYDISIRGPRRLVLHREGGPATESGSLGELLYDLEADLVVQVQLERPDLLFLHAAALEHEGRAILLIGRSGAGKSTTCWGLLHHGFRYLSDEIAPLTTGSRPSVRAYPHALCMKRAPPRRYPTPPRTFRTSRGLHVPPPRDQLAGGAGPIPVAATFLVEYRGERTEPGLSAVGPAEAAARVYPCILNALAHENDGLAAAAALGSGLPVFELRSADLSATCRLVQERVATLES